MNNIIKLTEEQIKVYECPDVIMIPFIYPDGEENPAAVIFSNTWCREEFWSKWTELNDFGINDGYEYKLEKLYEDMIEASEEGEAKEGDILLFDYIASEQAAEDYFGPGNY